MTGDPLLELVVKGMLKRLEHGSPPRRRAPRFLSISGWGWCTQVGSLGEVGQSMGVIVIKFYDGRLSGLLKRTKTTGAGKRVKELPFHVASHAWIEEPSWLRVGWEIVKGNKGSDEILIPAGSSGPSVEEDTVMPYAEAVACSVEVFKARTTPDGAPLIPDGWERFWTSTANVQQSQAAWRQLAPPRLIVTYRAGGHRKEATSTWERTMLWLVASNRPLQHQSRREPGICGLWGQRGLGVGRPKGLVQREVGSGGRCCWAISGELEEGHCPARRRHHRATWQGIYWEGPIPGFEERDIHEGQEGWEAVRGAWIRVCRGVQPNRPREAAPWWHQRMLDGQAEKIQESNLLQGNSRPSGLYKSLQAMLASKEWWWHVERLRRWAAIDGGP